MYNIIKKKKEEEEGRRPHPLSIGSKFQCVGRGPHFTWVMVHSTQTDTERERERDGRQIYTVRHTEQAQREREREGVD